LFINLLIPVFMAFFDKVLAKEGLL